MESWSDEYITLAAAQATVPVSVAHCPSEAESLGHLAGYEASLEDPNVQTVSSKATLEHETDPTLYPHHEKGIDYCD